MSEELEEWKAGVAYQGGSKVQYQGSLFYSAFWTDREPGRAGDDPNHNAWRLFGEKMKGEKEGIGDKDSLQSSSSSSSSLSSSSLVIGYLPSWVKGAAGEIHTFKNVTNIIVAFLCLSEDGGFTDHSLAEVGGMKDEVIKNSRENGVKVSIAVGGATDRNFNDVMTKIGNDISSPLLMKLVDTISNYVINNNFDGVDLDLESWWASANGDQGGRKSGDPHPAGKALSVLALFLRQKLGKNKIISAALPATSWYGNNFEGAKLAEYVDWLGIMCYDVTGSWNTCPVGPQSMLKRMDRTEMATKFAPDQQNPAYDFAREPIQSVEESLWFWSNKHYMDWLGAGQSVPREKIVIGVPTYGYDFAKQKGPGQTGYSMVTLKETIEKYPTALKDTSEHPRVCVPGSSSRPWFIQTPSNYPFDTNLYFETPHVAASKMHYAKSSGAKGVMVWETSGDIKEDGKSILHALYFNSGNPQK